MKIILASGSERRKKIFEILFRDFIQIIPDVDETRDYINNSILKSKSGFLKYVENNHFNGNILSIGVDTVVIYKGEIFGKFKSEKDVIKFFTKISGKWHYIVTAVTFYKGGSNYFTFVERSKVKFRKLNREEIIRYLQTEEWIDVAGGYRIQGIGGIFIERYKGSFSNIIGFPVEKFLKYYKKLIRKKLLQ